MFNVMPDGGCLSSNIPRLGLGLSQGDLSMNLNDVMWHIDNFVNTWTGWYNFFNGFHDILGRFSAAITGAQGANGDAAEGAKAFFGGLSSNPEGATNPFNNGGWPFNG